MTSSKRKKRKKTQAKKPPTVRKTADAAPVSKQSSGRIWLFRLTSLIVIPLLVFSLLEIGLRLGGYGYQPDFYIESEGAGDFRSNNRFGWRFFPSALARSPEPHLINHKSGDTIRIFILGGSAAEGIPDAAFSFGRILEVMLQARHPEMKFEVVNAAMTAINSHVVLEIARDCSGFQPDLFIVYMGNNEVIGPFGPGTVFSKLSSNLHLVRANLRVKSARTGQFLDNTIRALYPETGSKVWRGMELFINNPVTADDPRLEAVYDNFRRNLKDICEVGREAGAGVIVSTVAVNLQDCPPFASRHRVDLTDSELGKWDSIYGAGTKHEKNKEWMEALSAYEKAAQLDDRHAELQFRTGTCLAELGRFEEARKHFLAACNLDILRFRADRKINEIIREVAAAAKEDGIRFVDSEQLLTQENTNADGIPGDDFFYEHVHYNFDGNYRLAGFVLNQVEASIPRLDASSDPNSIPTKEQCARALIRTSWDEYFSLTVIANMVSSPPFTNQLNHSARIAAIKDRAENLRKMIFLPENYEESCNGYEAALEKKPGDWGLHYRFGKLLFGAGESERAADHFYTAQETYPWHKELYVELGIAEFQNGRIEKAVSHFNKALEIQPDDAAVHYHLMVALTTQGRIDEASEHFHRAVDINPRYEQAYLDMGIVRGKQGDIEEAMELFKKVLEINPENLAARFNLGTDLISRGRIDEAIDNFRKVIELDPDHEKAHISLGSALISRGDIDEGIGCYQKTLAANPRNASIYFRMARAESNRGRIPKAVEYYRKVLEIDPRFVEAHLDLGSILGSQGNIRASRSHVQKALEIDPENATGFFLLGNLHAVQGETDKAIANYKNALKFRPGFEDALRALQSLQ